MKLILKSLAFGVCGFPAMACAGGVAALQDEAWDEAVEDGVVVVSIEAVLEEGPGGEGGLFGKEFEEEVAGCGG